MRFNCYVFVAKTQALHLPPQSKWSGYAPDHFVFLFVSLHSLVFLFIYLKSMLYLSIFTQAVSHFSDTQLFMYRYRIENQKDLFQDVEDSTIYETKGLTFFAFV